MHMHIPVHKTPEPTAVDRNRGSRTPRPLWARLRARPHPSKPTGGPRAKIENCANFIEAPRAGNFGDPLFFLQIPSIPPSNYPAFQFNKNRMYS